MVREANAAAIILAAGYGSRIKGFSGNKTLLPLMPESAPFRGRHPIIVEIIGNLPPGPKALVLHHRREEVIGVTRGLGVCYCDQPVPNGTGGALIAAKDFLEGIDQDYLIITMGDAPFVKRKTYESLIGSLDDRELVAKELPDTKVEYGDRYVSYLDVPDNRQIGEEIGFELRFDLKKGIRDHILQARERFR